MHWITYLWNFNKQKTAEDRLVMTVLCRNEVDIIESNIRTHARLGVDAFLVMDNGSTDGTREILEQLTTEFEVVVIDQPLQTYQQAKWMKELAHYARDEMNASWVISNDADEFWIPQDEGKTLKDYLNHSDSVVTVKRHNMLLTEEALEPDYHFSQAKYYIKYPVCYTKEDQINDRDISMLFPQISPKVVINPNGFIKLSGGNHRAKHIGKFFTARNESDINVYHYPIRSFLQFKNNIKNRARLLEKTTARMGDHYRRWTEIYEEGGLYKEYTRLTINEAERLGLKKLGIIAKQAQLSEVLFKGNKTDV